MKIKKVDDGGIYFDNGNIIEAYHYPDCCENNYADFEQLEQLAYDTEFDENLIFEESDFGFRFGNEGKMFYVPCYSIQNGYYSSEVTITYKGADVLKTYGAEEE